MPNQNSIIAILFMFHASFHPQPNISIIKDNSIVKMLSTWTEFHLDEKWLSYKFHPSYLTSEPSIQNWKTRIRQLAGVYRNNIQEKNKTSHWLVQLQATPTTKAPPPSQHLPVWCSKMHLFDGKNWQNLGNLVLVWGMNLMITILMIQPTEAFVPTN